MSSGRDFIYVYWVGCSQLIRGPFLRLGSGHPLLGIRRQHRRYKRICEVDPRPSEQERLALEYSSKSVNVECSRLVVTVSPGCGFHFSFFVTLGQKKGGVGYLFTLVACSALALSGSSAGKRNESKSHELCTPVECVLYVRVGRCDCSILRVLPVTHVEFVIFCFYCTAESKVLMYMDDALCLEVVFIFPPPPPPPNSCW